MRIARGDIFRCCRWSGWEGHVRTRLRKRCIEEKRQVNEVPMANTAIPLCVDLDGTLTRTDFLLEGFLVLVKHNPWAIFLCLAWLLHGKAHLKDQIAKRVTLDVGVLPYNSQLVDYLRDEHSSG